MPEDIREYIRAAQAAEIRGEKSHAVQLLKQAARLYESAGNRGRSLQMLRHAARLESDGAEPNQSPRDPPPSAPGAENSPARRPATATQPDAASSKAALAGQFVDRGPALPDPAADPQRPATQRDVTNRKASLARQLADRGPALADPVADAWCSFCCRPRAEVGALIAGPAGAFLCAECLSQASKLLGHDKALPAQMSLAVAKPAPAQISLAAARPSPVPSARPVAPRGAVEALRDALIAPRAAAEAPRAAAEIEFFDPQGVIPQLVDAMREGVGLVLLIGPPGSGKTACLRALEARGAGAYLAGADRLPERLEGGLLIDGGDQIDEG
ncbi:MAG TPA: ClpX C4-type zinc finger protein, partial [Myxococcaceae bacterium]|nr:ClpX C4-type zinc finger protein [Myxococcaceae bacterium]